MNKALKFVGPALVIAGLVLLYMAYEAHNSAAGTLTNMVSGSPSDRALQLGIGGAVCLLLGLGGGAKAFSGK